MLPRNSLLQRTPAAESRCPRCQNTWEMIGNGWPWIACREFFFPVGFVFDEAGVRFKFNLKHLNCTGGNFCPLLALINQSREESGRVFAGEDRPWRAGTSRTQVAGGANEGVALLTTPRGCRRTSCTHGDSAGASAI